MKVIVYLFVFFLLNVFVGGNAASTKKVFHIPPEASAKILEGVLKCLQKLNLDATIITQIKDGKYLENDKVIETLICSNTETGYGSAEGRINVEIVMKEMFTSTPGIQTAMDACEKDYGKTPVENLKSFLSCFRKEVPFKVRV